MIAAGALGAVGVPFVVSGCGDAKSGVADAKLPKGVRSRNVEHESCDEGGHRVDVLDANNDGKPDIKRVYAGQKEICRVSDLNFDGKPDMYEYYDAAGQVRRREADYDDNGIVNAIEYYEGGRMIRRELDTSNQGKIDTWDTFDPATGKPLKRERDTSGDGTVDQWWTYEGERVTILADRNGDGQPEPESMLVLGAGGFIDPAKDAAKDGGVGPATTANASAAGDAGASAPPLPPPPALPSSPESGPRMDVADAGTPGKPQRGGAKR